MGWITSESQVEGVIEGHNEWRRSLYGHNLVVVWESMLWSLPTKEPPHPACLLVTLVPVPVLVLVLVPFILSPCLFREHILRRQCCRCRGVLHMLRRRRVRRCGDRVLH
jgi:hypothetical protein